MRNGWTAKWVGSRQKTLLDRSKFEIATAQRLELAGASVDNDPTVEVGSIGEKDPGAKYPAEGLIRGRVLLQSRVYVMELFLREGAGRGVRVRSLYVAIGGGVVARHHCSGRSRSSDARCIQSSNGPTTPPLSNRGNRVRVGGSWGRRRVNGGRDDCSDIGHSIYIR